MCGIAGFIDLRCELDTHELSRRGRLMAETLRHRGPDNIGVWADEKDGLCLGHTRLSIIDLSPAGNQPMESKSGRYVLSYNGEIYNYRDLRKRLPAETLWKGHSDTETLVEAFDHLGIDETLQAVKGMFAFALYDRQERLLHLCRDRMGEKPLYYGLVGSCFAFGSELKALRALPERHDKIDPRALELYLHFSYIPAPYSIYRSIKKVLPGSLVTIPVQMIRAEKNFDHVTERKYWDLNDFRCAPCGPALRGEGYKTLVRQALLDSVEGQMISDMPLGAFLSAGIDSSLVVSIMQSLSRTPVNTFTIGFGHHRYDEAVYSKEIAKYLGTHHTELYVDEDDMLDVVPELPFIYDEPFADSSQVPTYLLSKLVKNHVSVSLSGDGGDELFAGYNRYTWIALLNKLINRLPFSVRRALYFISTFVKTKQLNRLISVFAMLRRKPVPAQLDQLYRKFFYALLAQDLQGLYTSIVAMWKNRGGSAASYIEEVFSSMGTEGPPRIVDAVRLADMQTYLPDDILVKVDRASMRVSLESRAPYLDADVVAASFAVPLEYKLREGESKWVLRRLLYDYVPERFFNRPKAGFSVPVDMWLRGKLKSWAKEKIDRKKIQEQGIIAYDAVRKAWDEHQSGKRNRQDELWNFLMLQSWLDVNYN